MRRRSRACRAFLGHLFPVWLGFRGGKGVATFLGTLLALAWPVGLAACATWAVTAAVTRISSLSALVAAALAPVWLLLFGQRDMVVLAILLAALVFLRHKANIAAHPRRHRTKNRRPIHMTRKDPSMRLAALALATALLPTLAAADVETILADAAKACAEQDNGTFTSEGAVKEVDLTGDGTADTVVDEALFQCSTAASLYGGTGGSMVPFPCQRVRDDRVWCRAGIRRTGPAARSSCLPCTAANAAARAWTRVSRR